MMPSLKVCCLFVSNLCLLITTVVTTDNSKNHVQIQTPNSIFIGKRIDLDGYDVEKYKTLPTTKVDEYLGIRYGEVPQRFHRPLPTWIDPISVLHQKEGHESKTRQKQPRQIDATKWAPSCQQQPGFMQHALWNDQMSENCLYLNLWIPSIDAETISSLSSLVLKPVLVWFHGGSFISDTSSRKLYYGAHLAAYTDVVVVTVNFRVDVYGFLYTGFRDAILNDTTSAAGNQALWDQLLALEWIRDHIEYFGGDPKRITLIGHNSGSTSVGMHLLSPASRKYFHRAVLMSSSIFTQLVMAVSNVATTTAVADMWLDATRKIAGCTESDQHYWTKRTWNCLLKATNEQLLQMLDPLAKQTLAPEVVIGEELFPFNNLLEGIENIQHTNDHDHEVLFGSTNDEGSLVLPLVNMRQFSLQEPPTMDRKRAYDELRNFASLLVPPRGVSASERMSVNGDEVARYYVNQYHGTSSYHRLIGEAIGDFYVSCPAQQYASKIAATNRTTVYQYVWSYKLSKGGNSEVPCADWMGACHGTDVVMLFGMPFAQPSEYTVEDRHWSARFMQMIKNFVHYGNPGKQEGKQWSAYKVKSMMGTTVDTATTTTTMPYYEFGVKRQSTSNRIYRQAWKREVCTDLWSKYLLPHLPISMTANTE